MDQLWQAIAPELVSLVVTILGIVSTWAINSLRRKLDVEHAGAILDQVERVTNLVVLELEQTMVPEIKAALADGKLSEAEAVKLRELAIERVQSHVGKDVPVALIVSAIEATILRFRANTLKLKAEVYGTPEGG